jgi:hypothetical protein
VWSCERRRGYPTRWPRARPSGHTRLAARAQTEGEWVSMRPTGAFPFQEDWKGLHTAGRYPTPPFQPMQYLRPCVQNFPGSTSVDSDPTHPWRPKALQEMGIRVRKRTAAEVNSANRVEGTRLTRQQDVGVTSRIPHSVAKGPPEWSHESSAPRPKGSGCLCDRRVHCPSSRTGRAYMPPGDIHHHPSNP